MRSWLVACAMGLLGACGQQSETSGAADDHGDSETTTTSMVSAGDSADDGDTDDEPPFDRSQCVLELTGELDWSTSLLSTVERGGGRDLARASSDSVYVVDDCVSRWDQQGYRRWEVQNVDWSCVALDVLPDGGPVVVGTRDTDDADVPLVIAFDEGGDARWGLPPEEPEGPPKEPPEPPPEEPPEPEPDRMATDVVVDSQGRIYVTGVADPRGAEPPWTWLSRLDPDDGHVLWTVELEPRLLGEPELTLAGDRPVLAEPRLDDVGIRSVALLGFDPEGNEQWSWSSVDALGLSLELVAHDGDYDGSIVLLGRDTSLAEQPNVLLLLDSLGNPRWVRSGLDVPWLRQTPATVALDPCGAVVLAGAGSPEDASWGHLWVLKLDRAAEPRWNHYVPAPYFSRETIVPSIRIEADGAVLATGTQVTDVQEFNDEIIVFMDAWLGRILP